NASTKVDVYSIRQPLGPVGIISPFNFPAMVPMWFFPIAIAAGNTVVLKPSEKDPSASLWMANLWAEAGLPPGVFNVLQGDKTAERARGIRTGDGTRDADMGPLVTKAHSDKVASYIDAGEADGAKIVVDGRGVTADGGAEGFWLGPTLIDNVTPEMSIYTDEIFGPVLSVLRVETYDDALELINSNPYGNGTA